MPSVLAAAAMAVATLPFTAPPAQAVTAASPIIGPHGFPQWYEDADGQRVELCLDSINCSAALGVGGEAVYWAAAAAPPAGLTGQGIDMEITASFDPTTGNPLVSGRIRIRVRDLVPGEQYTFTHPYGRVVATAALDPDPVEPDDLTGRVRYIQEVGCVVPEVPDGTPTPPAPPCDFTSPLTGPLFGGFLRQPGAPAGHLGEGLLALTPRPVQNGPRGNFFQVEGPGVPQGAPPTTDWLVEGRLAAPVTATLSSNNFGARKVGSAVTRRVTVQNTSTQPLTLEAPALTGSGAGDFTVEPAPARGCGLGARLSAGATCGMSLTFQPSAPGFRTATLNLPNSLDGGNLVRSLTVTGTGANPRAVIRGALSFGDVGLGQRRTLPLTISNPGDVDLGVTSVRRRGSSDFVVNATSCTSTPVRARRSCVVDVTYRPRALGRDGATLTVTHDAAGSPSAVVLSGRGVDTTAPAIRTLRVPPRFHPPGSAQIIVGLDGPGTASLHVVRGQRVVRILGPVRFPAAGSRRTTWNGRDRGGRVVRPGVYRVRVTARDAEGNASVRSAPIRVTR